MSHAAGAGDSAGSDGSDGSDEPAPGVTAARRQPAHSTPRVADAPARARADVPAPSGAAADRPASAASVVPPHSTRPWPLPLARSPRVERLRAAVAGTPVADAERAVDAFWAEVRSSGTPLVEPSAHQRRSLVTFLWRGDAPHGVLLASNRFTDFTDPADTVLEAIAGTDVHAITFELPDNWRGSYALGPLGAPLPVAALHRGVDRAIASAVRGGLGADPLARDRLGGDATRSVCALPDAPAEPWPAADVPGYRTVRVRPPASGIERDLHLWSHPLATPDSPLVLCLDGQDWHGSTPLAAALARRIDDGELPPLRLALLESGGLDARRLDLACEPAESAGLLDAVTTAVASIGPAQDGPVVVAGQSLGGLFALLCASRHPERVGAAVAQSPSLWWPNDPPWQRHGGRWFAEDAAVAHRGSPVVLQYGVLEWDLEQAARHASAQLASAGRLLAPPGPGADAVTGGHDLAWWREYLPEAIARAVRATTTHVLPASTVGRPAPHRTEP